MEDLAGPQDQYSSSDSGSNCQIAKYPPQALEVLKKWDEVGRVEQEEVATLRENLRATLNDPNYSDVQFVCKDGGRVHACRWLLVTMSSMFKSLLTNGMAESRMKEIELPTITTSAMLATVEFLYTGGIVQHQLTWVSAFEIIHASRYFLIEKLGDYVMTFLRKAFRSNMDYKLSAWCFTQLAESSAGGKHLLEHSVSASLVRELTCKMNKMDPYSFNHLSVGAFSLYLDATESMNTTTISFKEYLRLRSILMWACTRVSPLTIVTLEECLPDEKWLRDNTFEALKGSQSPFATMDLTALNLGFVKWIQKLDRGWSSVKLQCIHPLLLVKVLEPLQIIPTPLMVAAFRYQALEAGNMNMMKWKGRPNLPITLEDNETRLLGSVDHSRDNCSTVAGTMLINHGMCEWDIMVESRCDLIYIGLCGRKHSRFFEYDSHTWHKWLMSDGWLYSANTRGKKYGKPFGDLKNSWIRVHVDMTLRTCAFTIDGETFGTAWSDIPDEVYPVVAFDTQCNLRIRVASDPDFW